MRSSFCALLSLLLFLPAFAQADGRPKVLCIKPDGTIAIRSKCRPSQTQITDVAFLQALITPDLDFKGEKGEKGDTGATGPEGPAGPQGDTGSVGPQGPKGDKGDTGDQGPKGDKGDTGAQGSTGPTGPQGMKGDTGDKGDKGDKGDPGVSGGTVNGTLAGCPGLNNQIFTLSLAGTSYTTRLGSASRDYAFHSVLPGTYTVDVYQFDNPILSIGSVEVFEGTTTTVDFTVTDCGGTMAP